jgi:hypothetical protein
MLNLVIYICKNNYSRKFRADPKLRIASLNLEFGIINRFSDLENISDNIIDVEIKFVLGSTLK